MRQTAVTYFLAMVILLSSLSCSHIRPTVQEQQRIKFKASAMLRFTSSRLIYVGDTANHIISLSESEGTLSSGPWLGAYVTMMTFSDHIAGKGIHWGYFSLEFEGDSVYGKWDGKINTIGIGATRPTMIFEGKFNLIKGTGQFMNITGSGTYEGKFVSKRRYFLEMEGVYSIERE